MAAVVTSVVTLMVPLYANVRLGLESLATREIVKVTLNTSRLVDEEFYNKLCSDVRYCIMYHLTFKLEDISRDFNLT